MLEFGKRYTWQEIIDTYPNRYVFVTDLDEDAKGRRESAIFLDAATFEERGDKAKALSAKGIEFSLFWTKGPTEDWRILF